MIILGVDPGTAITGYGIIQSDGDELGLIDFDGPLEQARVRFRIDNRSMPWTTGKAWSQQIRACSEPSTAR